MLGLQAGVVLGGFILGALIGGAGTAWAAATGGIISLVATAWFALRVFPSRKRGRPAKAMMRGFYVGEVQKILLTVALFVIAIAWLRLEFLPMFLTYMAGLMAFWLALLPVMAGANE
ncbi:ATP synthase subunit I [Ectothiorhodospira mobilis]|uniref:ATP synthase subunit I n=1 Tax=Ectothiorhodospira mobilis TaxID=195064 RepID=UPI0030B802E9